MDFKEPYLLAMREQAPRMFNELRRTGTMDRHLQEMSERAHAMFREIVGPTNEISPAQRREAEERVRATLIEFPPTNVATDETGEPIPQTPRSG